MYAFDGADQATGLNVSLAAVTIIALAFQPADIVGFAGGQFTFAHDMVYDKYSGLRSEQ